MREKEGEEIQSGELYLHVHQASLMYSDVMYGRACNPPANRLLDPLRLQLGRETGN